MRSRRLSLVTAGVSIVLLFGATVHTAQAAAGNVDNARMSGTWNYSCTYSYASAAAKSSGSANALVQQDGRKPLRLINYKGRSAATIMTTGVCSNRNDTARVW